MFLLCLIISFVGSGWTCLLKLVWRCMLRSLLFCRFFTGYVSRGLLLHILRRVKPELASSLHEADKPKPSLETLRVQAEDLGEEGWDQYYGWGLVFNPDFHARNPISNDNSVYSFKETHSMRIRS